MERLLFCHSTINFKSVDTAELFHRTNFLGLKKKERGRQKELLFFNLHFVQLGHHIKGIKAL